MANIIAFDEQYYLQQNPDVAAAVSRKLIASAADHYEQYGRFESRNPNAYFNTSFYLGQYPDVAKAGVNPLTHFLANGASEGRLTNATEKGLIDLNGNGSAADDFNETAYRAAYSDVDAAIKSGALKSAYQHFVTFGQFEGRTATLSNGTTVTGPITNTGVATNAGATFSFTTGVDSLVGTSANDTFTADNTQSTKTLTVADSVNGGPGNDTLKIFLAAGDTSIPAASITGIENLVVNGGALASLDATKISGLTAVTLDSTVQTAAAANAAAGTVVTTSGQIVTLTNLSTGGTAGQTAITQLTSTSDTSASVVLNNVNSKAVTGGTVTQTVDLAGTKVATANITSTGSANTVTLTNTGAALATLNVSGDKALTLSENIGTLKAINASAATGNVTIDTSAGTANAALSFTGGAGNDKIIFASGAVTSTTVLNGGAGTDTLVIRDVSLTSANAGINAATNFEILGFAGGTSSQGIVADLSKVTSVSQFSIETATTGGAATAGVNFSGEANTQSIILNSNVTGGAATATNGFTGLVVTPGTDNGSNVATLSLNGVTVSGSAAGTQGTASASNFSGGAAADLSSFETVNISSNTNAAGTGTNAFVGGAVGTGGVSNSGSAGAGLLVGANATVNISGSADIDLGSVVSNLGSTTNNNLTLNASALTGKLTVVTGAGNDVITGGSGVSTITLGGGADTVDITRSTAKADTIAITSATGTLKTGISISGFTDAATTGDKLDLLGTPTIVTSGTGTVGTGATAVTATIGNGGLVTFSAVGASAGLSDYIDATFKAINSNSTGFKAAAFQFGGDTYVVEENSTSGTAGQFDAGTDVVVKLVGVTGTAGLQTTGSDGTHIFVA